MASHSDAVKRWIVLLGGCVGVLVLAMSYVLVKDRRDLLERMPQSLEAQNIRIVRSGFDDIDLIRSGGQWQVSSPCRLAINQQRLTPLLSALSPGAHVYSASEVDLQAAGLETPLAVIYLNEVEHRLGNTDLDGDRRYLQRGDAVELIPEWVLSLVNGGISALAMLEVFPAPLTQLSVTPAARTPAIVIEDSETLALWQTLTAQQIVTWPIADIDPVSSYELEALDIAGESYIMQVVETDSYTAITFDEARCAYILGTDALPAL